MPFVLSPGLEKRREDLGPQEGSSAAAGTLVPPAPASQCVRYDVPPPLPSPPRGPGPRNRLLAGVWSTGKLPKHRMVVMNSGPSPGRAAWPPAIGGPDPAASAPTTEEVPITSQGDPGPRDERSPPLKRLPPLNPRPRLSFHSGHLLILSFW